MNLLNGLNSGQEDAVLQTDGPVLVLAGAGSGKTRAIIHRVAYLLDGGINPRRILAVTFTNKAAEEMRGRAIKMVGDVAEKVLLCTFHSLCARILRVHIEKLKPMSGRQPYKMGFSIYDDSDKKRLCLSCLKDLGQPHNADSVKAARKWISYAKIEGLEPENLEAHLERRGESRFARVYELYLERAAACNALDFDDLLALTLRLLDENEEVLSIYQDRFEYCMVDEFQDTNRTQYELIKTLSGKHKNLFVVGDDDQSIYSFRGANIRNILDFEKDFPDAVVIHLDQNYRSTENILSAASALIEKNRGRMEKRLFTENTQGEQVVFCTCADERAEAEFVCSEIQDIQNGCDSELGSIGVFYRTNAQSRAIEDELLKRQIPYTMVRGHRFYERKEVKDVIAYLKVAVNPDDEIALERIINTPPRGIGKTSIDLLKKHARGSGISLFGAVSELMNAESVRPALRKKLGTFCSLMQALRAASTAMGPPKFVEHLINETGYFHYLIEDEGEGEQNPRAENVKELVTVARGFAERNPNSSALDFTHHIALLSDVDQLKEQEDTVSLLTLHSAKGLEFDVVFLVGVEAGLLPHYSVSTREQLEEERRLLYVGMTRAKKMLILTRAWRRSIFGRTAMNPGSPFIQEIPAVMLKTTAFYGDGI
ncbi:UvrD-helicase domain-containing protein [bacterium]|nr:UvrD-helicase domain-containing protein [bacterium]